VSSTIYVTWSVDGVPTNPDPDTATITITKDSDGEAVVTDDPTTDIEDTDGLFGYTLTPDQVPDLDIYHAAWTSTFNGQQQALSTEVEIVGGVLFTIGEARALDTELADTTKYTAAQIAVGRGMASDALEEACGVAFRPRYAKQTGSGTGGTNIALDWSRPRTIRSSTATGVTLSDLVPTGIGAYYSNGFTAGTGNVVTVYEHGFDRPPARVKRAAIRLCRHFLTEYPTDDRTMRFDTEVGSFTMAQPGMMGFSFGIPEVDSVVNDYSENVTVG
jgi:hypothetical protein